MTDFYVMGYRIALLKLETLKGLKEKYAEFEKRYSERIIRDKAREDGERDFPAVEQEYPAPYERELLHGSSKLASHVVGTYKAALELLDAKIKTEKDFIEQRCRDARDNAELIHKEKSQAVENSLALRHAHEFLEFSEKRYRDMSARLGRAPVRYIPLWLYVMFAAAIFAGEIPLNALVFQIFGENQLMTWVMAVIIGLCIPISAHFVGIKLREADRRLFSVDLLKAVLGACVIVAALYGLSLMRQTYLGAYKEELGLTDALVQTSFMFFWLNIAVFGAAIMLSYLAHDSEPGFERAEHEYERARRTVQKLERRRIALLRQIGMERARALKDGTAEYRDGMSRVNMMYGCYDQILREGQEHEERCLEALRRNIAIYRDQNLKCRSDRAMPRSFHEEPAFPLKLQLFKEKLSNEDLHLPKSELRTDISL